MRHRSRNSGIFDKPAQPSHLLPAHGALEGVPPTSAAGDFAYTADAAIAWSPKPGSPVHPRLHPAGAGRPTSLIARAGHGFKSGELPSTSFFVTSSSVSYASDVR